MISKDTLRRMLVCLALLLGTLLLYAPVRHFDFVNYDDPIYVINNFHIRAFDWQAMRWCFQTGYASLWHPVTWLSYMLDWHWYGLHPGGYHVTNVVLHALNAALLFLGLQRMTGAFWRSAMVAALFAWHPLHVESVAWISERKDVLSVFFWMLTIWAYLCYVQEVAAGRAGGNSKSKFFYVWSIILFAIGLMAKPMVVTLPFVLLLLDFWPLGRFQIKSAPAQGGKGLETRGATPVWRLVAEKIPFFLLSLMASALTLHAASVDVVPLARLPLAPRLLNALVLYLRYVEKMIWPRDLIVVYPFEFHWSAQEVLVAALFLVIVSVAAVRLRKTRPFWLVGWLAYLGILVPVIGLVQVGAQPMADRYTYLSSIGIFIIVCWEVCDIAVDWKYRKVVLGALAVSVLGACLALSAKQIQYWRNPVTLFQHTLAVTPNNAVAHANYAAFLRDASQLKEARAECAKALKLSPNYAWAHQVLGGILFLEGQLAPAAAEFRLALRLDPSRVDVHLGLGKVALAQNSLADAASDYAAVLASDPANPEAHCGLGQAFAMQGKLDEARAQYEEALRLASRYPEAHYQLAVVLAAQGHTVEAISHYRTALALQPDRYDALNNLAWILATDPRPEIRDGAAAVKFALEACKLTADKNATTLGTLAAAYAEAGRFDDAVKMAQKARDVAAAQGASQLAARNLELLGLYRAHQAYHEKP